MTKKSVLYIFLYKFNRLLQYYFSSVNLNIYVTLSFASGNFAGIAESINPKAFLAFIL